MEVEKILGRKQHTELLDISMDNCSVLITGASGSIGKRLIERLYNCDVTATDIVGCVNKLDVTDVLSIRKYQKNKYDYIINLSGAKHAPEGEITSFETLDINTLGTLNLIKAFPSSKIILTSTCKSCNPETVYGATKLIAERLTLNSGNSVARFFNVVETSGNVFEIWKDQKIKEVANLCNRYFVSLDEAVGLIIYTMKAPVGRYSVNPMSIRNMMQVFNDLYPNETARLIAPRRGDRVNEKKHGTSEEAQEELNGAILKIINYHDAN